MHGQGNPAAVRLGMSSLALLVASVALALAACGGSASASATSSSARSLPSGVAPDMIAFTKDTKDGTAICVVRPDGTGLRRLCSPGVEVAWSPDGSRVAYGAGDVCVMNADGSGRRSIDAGGWWGVGWHPSWSPDGKRIVTATPERHLLVADVSGKAFRELRTRGQDPAWGADGRIYYAGQGGIHSVMPDGSDARVVTATTSNEYFGGSFALSPDGKWLVMYDVYSDRLLRLAASGQGSEVVLVEEVSRYTWWRDISLTWSANGRQIAFAADRPLSRIFIPRDFHGSRLYIADAFGTLIHGGDNKPPRAVPHTGMLYEPAWRPQ